MSEKLKVTLKTANRKPLREGFMVIGDGVVDGQDTTVIFWDPPNPDSLTPGTELEVNLDGKDAAWREKEGKVSFQIRKGATLTILGQGTTQPAHKPQVYDLTNEQPEPVIKALSVISLANHIADNALALKTALTERGFSEAEKVAVLKNSGLTPPVWWFGERTVTT